MSWQRFLNPGIDRIVCVANAVRDYFLQMRPAFLRLPPQKLVTIHKGHSLDWYRAPPADLRSVGVPPGSFVIGCVVNYRPRKGIELLVDALGKLPAEWQAHLLLIGGGMDAPALAKRIAASPVAANVRVMSHRRIIELVALLSTAFAQAGFAAEPVKVVVLEPGQGALVSLLKREVANAATQHAVPFLQITAEWCVPCKKLRASLGDPQMQDAFAGTYIIRVDSDAWKNELKKVGFDHPAIPVFFAVDSSARPTGAKIDGGAWGEDIPANMAPPLKRFFGEQIAAAAERH